MTADDRIERNTSEKTHAVELRNKKSGGAFYGAKANHFSHGLGCCETERTVS